MPRCTLGACTLGLVLAAGCLAPTEDPAPSPGDPAPPPVDEPPAAPPPVDQPPATEPPEPAPGNAPGDAYDAAHHRVLYADCAAGALMAVDLASGARSVVADAWPWAEASDVCVASFVGEPAGERVFAVVERAVPALVAAAAVGEASCTAADLVAIDATSGAVTPLRSLAGECCDGCATLDTSALQLDLVHQRLLHLDTRCDAGACASQLESLDFDAAAAPLSQPVSAGPGALARWFTLDPAAPERSVLLLLEDGTIDALDVTTGGRSQRATIQAAWDGGIEIQYTTGIAVDAAGQRAFVAAVALWPGPDALFVVVAIDLVTGAQTLLYDGSPTAEGTMIACHPAPSFDTREKRVLMVEAIDASGCAGRVFAVDATTGALTLVAGAAP